MNRFPLVLAAMLFLTACTTDTTDVTTDRQEAPVPIVFTVAADGDVTRAGTALLSNLAGKNVNVYMQATKPGTPSDVSVAISGLTADHAVYTVGTLSSGSYPLTNATTFYKPGAATAVSAYALYPTSAAPTGYGESVSFTINTNQNSDANYEASDLCHASVVALAGDNALSASLAFHHLMAKVTVTVDNQLTSGAITKVELLNVKPTLTFTPSTYTFSSSSLTGLTTSGSETITLYEGSGIAVGNSGSFSCVIPPQTIAAGNFIRITKGGSSGIYDLGSSTTFYPGTNNQYTITVNPM